MNDPVETPAPLVKTLRVFQRVVSMINKANQRHHSLFLVGSATIPVVIGGTVYVLWRSETLLMFRWFEFFGVAPMIQHLRDVAAPIAAFLPHWVLRSLPDALWVYSFTVFMGALWARVSTRAALVAMALPAIVGVGGEIGQFLGVVCGHFDAMDLLLCSCSAFSGFLVIVQHTKRRTTSCINIQYA